MGFATWAEQNRMYLGSKDDAEVIWNAAVAAERERCAKLCEWLPIDTGLQGKTFAEAIRGVGMGGKMSQGFKA